MSASAGPVDADRARQREAERQQQLLRSLWRRDGDEHLLPWLQGGAAAAQPGLSAYRGNAAAIAERALEAVYPTVRQLIGEASFESLARALWHRHPPLRGDLAHWGEDLARFLEADRQLDDDAYLADVARLEWVVHRVEHAADAPSVPDGLPLLASEDPATIGLQLQDGAALLPSRWPIVRVWQAHRESGDDRFDAVRAAFAAGQGDCAWVWRDGWRARVQTVDTACGQFLHHTLSGASVGDALAQAGEQFDFAAWLRDAISQRWIVAVRTMPAATTEAGH